jgi:hypothetical protein
MRDCVALNSDYDFSIIKTAIFMEEFIEERVKLIRSLADKADPFIKPRLIRLAERYEHELWVRRRPAFGRYRGNLNAVSPSTRSTTQTGDLIATNACRVAMRSRGERRSECASTCSRCSRSARRMSAFRRAKFEHKGHVEKIGAAPEKYESSTQMAPARGSTEDGQAHSDRLLVCFS